jgi:hypothetical protein
VAAARCALIGSQSARWIDGLGFAEQFLFTGKTIAFAALQRGDGLVLLAVAFLAAERLVFLFAKRLHEILDHALMDHALMDHALMDHALMDHALMDKERGD